MASSYIARLFLGHQSLRTGDVEMAPEYGGGMCMPPTETVQAQVLSQAIWCCRNRDRIRVTSMVAAVVAVCGFLALIPTYFESDVSNPPRRLEQFDFKELDLLGPVFVISTAIVVNVLAVLGAAKGVTPDLQVVKHLFKFAIVDSVDQLVSIYVVIWAFRVGVGVGCKILAMLAAIIGNAAFLGHTVSLQQLIKEKGKTLTSTNSAGLLADLFSVGVMAAIELTATEATLLPGWLKGLDWIWSVFGIIGEMYAIMGGGNN